MKTANNQSTKTVTITVTVPDNYEWDEKQLRFRELINEPVDKADLTNAKVGDVYETNYGEKAVLVSTNGPKDFRFIFLVNRIDTDYNCETASCFAENGLFLGYNKKYYIKRN